MLSIAFDLVMQSPRNVYPLSIREIDAVHHDVGEFLTDTLLGLGRVKVGAAPLEALEELCRLK